MPPSDREGEAGGRSSLGEGSYTQGPIPLFDQQLKVIQDSYLAFFNERKKIEEAYVDALHKLHKRARIIDTYLDDHAEPTTTRRAWREVVDHAERESQTRQAFLTSLNIDVLTPLTAFKESQDRTRKRIKEDLKSAEIGYNEYADTLLKLKTRYIRRCQDAEDYRTSPTHHSNALSPTDTKAGPSVSHPPVVTAPQPLRPISRRASAGHGPSARARSPSSNTALQDLASQGKRQLNQLMTSFLDKRDTMREGGSGGGGITGGASSLGRTDPLRGVRAKREADEADKEYRRGVHWLETLRLRRSKILEAGYSSLTTFVHEGAERLRTALVAYSDTLAATSTTQTQLTSHLHEAVGRIRPDADAATAQAKVPRSLDAGVPEPVYYYNYTVGECEDLIWGISLVDYATARVLAEGEIPKIVRVCIREVDQRGLDSEGIYRVPGKLASVQELQRRIEANERAFRFTPTTDDVYTISSLLKSYLRDLPEPVFRLPMQDRLQHSIDRAEHANTGFALLRAKLRRLPSIHYAVLRAVIEHLARVRSRAQKNKMDGKNLAIVFNTVLFGDDELPRGSAELLAMGTQQDTVLEDMIEYAPLLFDENRATTPVIPTSASIPTGSSPSKVSFAPPPPPLLSPQSEMPPQIPPPILTKPIMPFDDADQAIPSRASGEDFTPHPPSRPPMSIHPSARNSILGSPTKSSFADAGQSQSQTAGQDPQDHSRPPSNDENKSEQIPPPSPSKRTSVITPRVSPPGASSQPMSPPTPSPRQRTSALPPPMPPRPVLTTTGPSDLADNGHASTITDSFKLQETTATVKRPPFVSAMSAEDIFVSAHPSPVDAASLSPSPSAPVNTLKGVAPERNAGRPALPPPQPIDLPTPPGDQAYVSVPFPSVGSPVKKP